MIPKYTEKMGTNMGCYSFIIRKMLYIFNKKFHFLTKSAVTQLALKPECFCDYMCSRWNMCNNNLRILKFKKLNPPMVHLEVTIVYFNILCTENFMISSITIS